MIVIKIKTNEYIKAGNPIFVYTLMSNLQDAKKATEELEQYKTTQGTNYRENDTKEPLYFSQRPLPVGAELKLTSKGRFTVLQDNLEELAVNASTQIESFKNQFLGKLAAVGVTPAQYKAALLANL
jgi:hypothetical protein